MSLPMTRSSVAAGVSPPGVPGSWSQSAIRESWPLSMNHPLHPAACPPKNSSRRPAISGLLALVALLSLVTTGVGCKSIGPGAVTRDRFSYSDAVASSWKSQMLLNLVKTRYLDLPIYLDVGQIVSGYTLETGVSLSGQLSPQSMRGDSFGALGARGTFPDRPTITYTPMTGEKFLQGFLDPIHPARVLALLRAGYGADFILTLSLESLNGWHNQLVSATVNRKADPEFFQATALLGKLQTEGLLGVKVEQPTNGASSLRLFLRTDQLETSSQSTVAELRTLLSLDPGSSSWRIVQSPLRGERGEFGLATRSLMQMLGALSLGIEIPASHVERRLVPPVSVMPPAEHRLLTVHSGPDEPDDSYVAVRYEDAWFWVANDDWKSKRTFSSILFLFTLSDAGGSDRLPVITIPAQ